METAISKARKNGVAVVGLHNSNHSGIMARYTLMAAEAGCIGIAMTNTPPLMAPWGGVTAFFGTNPFSIAVPAGDEPPLVMDMATSAVARSKILVARRKNERIPEDWARDVQGLPTNDPEEALQGTMAPMSGHKGFALALMIDLLSGILTGAASGPEVGNLLSYTPADIQNVGHYFQAIHIDHLMPVNAVEQRTAALIRNLRSAPLAPGVDRMHLPGDGGRETERQRREMGIPVDPDIRAEMTELGEAYGLPWPW
jgi:LDH2 family malate/lactate/ureidoglycolate dehydrogenase